MILMVAEHPRHFLRAKVATAIGSAQAPGLRGTSTQLSTLLDVEPLRSLPQLARGRVELLFADSPDSTVFECCDGSWYAVAAELCFPDRTSIESLSATFAAQVLPSSAHPATRSKHLRCSRGIFIWQQRGTV